MISQCAAALFQEILGGDFVIRFKGNIHVESAEGETKTATAWVPASGRATILQAARVTRERMEVPAIVVVKAKNMKAAWCLATTLSKRKTSDVAKLYGRRFTIEETFRDEKNLRFGLGLSSTHSATQHVAIGFSCSRRSHTPC